MHHSQNIWSKLSNTAFMLIAAVFAGAVGFKLFFPHESWLRTIFMSVTTLSTVGYDDLFQIGQHPGAIVFTIALIIFGMGIVLYAVSNITAFLVEGHVNELLSKRRTRRRAKRMKNHIIICGVGTTSIHVVREIYDSGHPLVVIDNNPKQIELLRKEFKKLPVIVGDAMNEVFLNEANIENAATLVATLSSDKDNLFITITAKILNPNIQVIARAIDFSLQPRFRKAGARFVISPNYIGGIRIAAQILRPNIHSFVDNILQQGKDKSISMNELKVPKDSPLIGKTLFESEINRKTGLTIISYSPDGTIENYIYNPSKDLVIEPGGIMMFIGSKEQREQIEMLIAQG